MYIFEPNSYKSVPFENVPPQWQLLYLYFWECIKGNRDYMLLKVNVKVTWHVAKYGNPYSEFVLCIYPIQSAHTQQWTHTHREHTPGAVGSHLCGQPCSRAPQSWYWRRRERCTFTPPTYNSCTWDSNPQPLGYEYDSLTIRPRLPLWPFNEA